MSRSLEDVLNGNAPKDREKIKQLIDRVLEKKRTEIGNGDGFDYADINAAAQKGAGYKVETLGEALMYIADEEAYSGIREQLDEISNKRFDVSKNHPVKYCSYPGDRGFNWGSDRIKDRIMGKLELCNKTKPFFQPIEISDYWRDWAREFCKYYSRMLLEKASSDSWPNTLLPEVPRSDMRMCLITASAIPVCRPRRTLRMR